MFHLIAFVKDVQNLNKYQFLVKVLPKFYQFSKLLDFKPKWLNSVFSSILTIGRMKGSECLRLVNQDAIIILMFCQIILDEKNKISKPWAHVASKMHNTMIQNRSISKRHCVERLV